MSYDEIADDLLAQNEIIEVCGEGFDMLPLCIGLLDGETADCFFCGVRTEDLERLESEVKATVNKKKIQIRRLDTDEIYISLRESDDNRAGDCYKELYSQIRKFAFSPTIDKKQENLLMQFMKSWESAIEDECKAEMKRRFPEFFRWTNQVLKLS